MWAPAPYEQAGTRTLAHFHEVMDFQFGALEPCGLDINRVHFPAEIKRDDERRLVFRKRRLFTRPGRTRQC